MLSVTAVNPRAKVLVVEDEEPLALLLRYNLEAEGYAVDVVHRGDDLGDRARAMPAARAADADRQVRLSLADVRGQEQAHQPLELLEK